MCVGGVGVLVFLVKVIMWVDVFVGLGVFLIKFVFGVLNWVIVFLIIRWIDVFVGILVVKNVGLFELELLGVNKCVIVIGIGVLLVNILVLINDDGDWDVIEFVEINW